MPSAGRLSADDPGRHFIEFVSHYLDLWADLNGVPLDFFGSGMPAGNGFIATFNSKLRAERPNIHWFISLADAREKPDAWLRDQIEIRRPQRYRIQCSACLALSRWRSKPVIVKEPEKPTFRRSKVGKQPT